MKKINLKDIHFIGMGDQYEKGYDNRFGNLDVYLYEPSGNQINILDISNIIDPGISHNIPANGYIHLKFNYKVSMSKMREIMFIKNNDDEINDISINDIHLYYKINNNLNWKHINDNEKTLITDNDYFNIGIDIVKHIFYAWGSIPDFITEYIDFDNFNISNTYHLQELKIDTLHIHDASFVVLKKEKIIVSKNKELLNENKYFIIEILKNEEQDNNVVPGKRYNYVTTEIVRNNADNELQMNIVLYKPVYGALDEPSENKTISTIINDSTLKLYYVNKYRYNEIKNIFAGERDVIIQFYDDNLFSWSSSTIYDENIYYNINLRYNDLYTPNYIENDIVIKDVIIKNTFIIVLDTSGFVHTSGINHYYQQGHDNNTLNHTSLMRINNLTNIEKIYTNGNTIFTIDNSGVLRSWGYNGNNELGIKTDEEKVHEPVEIDMYSKTIDDISKCSKIFSSIFSSMTYGIFDNKIYVWGDGSNNKPVLDDSINNMITTFGLADNSIVDIQCNQYVTIILDNLGNIYSKGNNTTNQMGTIDISYDNIDVSNINIKEDIYIKYDGDIKYYKKDIDNIYIENDIFQEISNFKIKRGINYCFKTNTKTIKKLLLKAFLEKYLRMLN